MKWCVSYQEERASESAFRFSDQITYTSAISVCLASDINGVTHHRSCH